MEKRYRFEYVYDRQRDITNIYIWIGTERIIDNRVFDGELSKYSRGKIRKELLQELVEEEE